MKIIKVIDFSSEEYRYKEKLNLTLEDNVCYVFYGHSEFQHSLPEEWTYKDDVLLGFEPTYKKVNIRFLSAKNPYFRHMSFPDTGNMITIPSDDCKISVPLPEGYFFRVEADFSKSDIKKVDFTVEMPRKKLEEIPMK